MQAKKGGENMLSVNGVTVRFGKRILFEDVNIKFGKGNCYGIIGANGAGKSTFLKVLSGELEPSKGDVTVDKGERISILKQDHFAYDEYNVLDAVIMGNQELYSIMKEKEEIDTEKSYSTTQSIAKLRRLADALEQGKSFEIQIDNNKISVPPNARIEFEYEKNDEGEEIEIEISWK